MATQRYISTSFWDDEWVQTLDPSEKLLYMYLMTNPLTSIAGVYKISVRRMCFDTGFNDETVKRILNKFQEAKKAYHYQEYMVLPAWPKHQKWQNKKTIRAGINAELKVLSATIKDYLFKIGYQYPMIGYTYEPSYFDSDIDSDIDIDSNSDSDSDNDSDDVPASPSPPSPDSSDKPTLFGESDNAKEGIKDTVPPAKVLPDEAIRLAHLLADLHRNLTDAKFHPKDSAILTWAGDIDKLNRIDGREWGEIEGVIRWVQTPGCFWNPNILSGKTLREKFDRLVAQMKQGSGVQGLRNAAKSDLYKFKVNE